MASAELLLITYKPKSLHGYGIQQSLAELLPFKYSMNRLIVISSLLFPSEPSDGRIGSIELNIWLAQTTGVPISRLRHQSKKSEIVLLVYGLIVLSLVTFLYTACEIYDFVLYYNDIDVLTQNICMTLTHIAGFTKIINILYRHDDIRQAIGLIKMATQTYVLSKNQRKTFFRGEFENKIPLLIYILLVGFTGCLAMVMLLYNPQNIAGKIFPYRVFLPTWLPYYLKLAYMGGSVLIIALQIVAVDYLNINLINQIRFQLKILNISFEDLMLDIETTERPPRRLLKALANPVISPHMRLVSIIEHHCLLMRLRADVESIFRLPILMQFFTSVVIFAMTGFQATVHTDGSQGAILIYFYCGCILCELFLYCWFGNDVFEQSRTLSFSGYNSSWYQFDQSFKKSLLIFLSNAQRPFVFTAGGFMGLLLPSFTGIVSKSYTYIAVLQRFYGK